MQKASDEDDAEEQADEEQDEDGDKATTKKGDHSNKNRQSKKDAGNTKEKISKLLDQIRGGDADTEEKEGAVEKLAKMTGIKMKRRRKRRVKRLANGYRKRMRFDGFLNDGFGWDGQEDGKIRDRKTGGGGEKEEGGFTLHYATFKEGKTKMICVVDL